jgi:demethylmenaquinone methyltransferase/2-methoxy-6-polyprenyl-1,4-benzoquinol methylase
MTTYILRPDSIRKLFDRVAPRYDFLNHLLSLRRDVYWRKVAVRQCDGIDGWILDIATGTGEVAIEALHPAGDRRKVVGLDFSEPMLRGAQRKIVKKKVSQQILLNLGDALTLPFRENTFGASMIAFGLRNILVKEKALSEMVRVTKEGGKVIILEFTLPQKGWASKIYPFYFIKILPWVGGLISGDRGAYAYLPESVLRFPCVEDYEGLMKRSGLQTEPSRGLTGGIVSLMVGMKPRP